MSKKSRRKVVKKSQKDLLIDRLYVVILVVSAIAMFILGVYLYLGNFPGPNLLSPTDERLIRTDSQVMGSRGADVSIVQFIDLACQECAPINPMLKRFVEKYEGRVNVIIRHLPLHDNSVIAAKAVESAASQGRFLEMEDLLLMKQEDWVNQKEEIRRYLLGRAMELELDVVRFNEDLDSFAIESRIERDRADAEKLGVRSTPTFFVNGHRLHHASEKHIAELIARYLSEEKSGVAQ